MDEPKPKVKFCGLSQAADVAAVNAAHPNYAGFVFWPKSRRAVTPDEAAALRRALDPRIATVGVFVNEALEKIARLGAAGTISIAQLHGEENAEYIARLRQLSPNLEIWQAFVLNLSEGATDAAAPAPASPPANSQKLAKANIAAANASTADLVLLDAGKGEGKTFDWRLLERITRPYALAGGLSPENIRAALATICATRAAPPAVVDVSSGIEAAAPAPDGRTQKDPTKMAQFMKFIERMHK